MTGVTLSLKVGVFLQFRSSCLVDHFGGIAFEMTNELLEFVHGPPCKHVCDPYFGGQTTTAAQSSKFKTIMRMRVHSSVQSGIAQLLYDL